MPNRHNHFVLCFVWLVLAETGADRLGFGLIAGFGQQGEHIALIGFYAWLVEWVDT